MIRSSDSGNFWWQIDAFLNDTVDQMQYYYGMNIYLRTVNPQKRPAGLILSLSVQMRVLLEFC